MELSESKIKNIYERISRTSANEETLYNYLKEMKKFKKGIDKKN